MEKFTKCDNPDCQYCSLESIPEAPFEFGDTEFGPHQCHSHCHKNECKFGINDSYILDYLLKKYKLDKRKLVLMLQKKRDNEYKLSIIDEFYNCHENITYRPICEQYKLFKNWNDSEIDITMDEFENYYYDHIVA